MIRFIHIADVHLGASPEVGSACEEVRSKELWETFSRVLDLCNEKQIDVLLIAGDLFHSQPLLKELKEVDYLFSKLEVTKVVLIAGNHDHMKGTSFYHSFSWSPNVTMLKSSDFESVDFKELKLRVSGFSYHERKIYTPELLRVEVPKGEGYNILLAHGGDASHIPFDKETLMQLKFDYIALGHFHRPEILIENKAAFAGALEPSGRGDMGAHGYIEGTIDDAGVHIFFVPFAKREYISLEVMVRQGMTGYEMKEKVAEEIAKSGAQNIYKVTLKGFRSEKNVPDLSSFFSIGNIIEIMDDTRPFYDFKKLMETNKTNIIGKFIREFIAYPEGSIEYEAMVQGVEALMASRVISGE